jgi:hypothetical protein
MSNTQNNKTKDLLVFISSKGCGVCDRIDSKAFRNKLGTLAAKYGKEFMYISLSANNAKLNVEKPELPSTIGRFPWFFPMFMMISKDQWNKDQITNPFIMDGKIDVAGRVHALQNLPYPLNLSGVEKWLEDIKTGKLTNALIPDASKPQSSAEPQKQANNASDNKNTSMDAKSGVNSAQKNAADAYQAQKSEDVYSQGPFMNDSKIDVESPFCSCTIVPKNRAYRVKS